MWLWPVFLCLTMQFTSRLYEPPPGKDAVYLLRWPWCDDYDGRWIDPGFEPTFNPPLPPAQKPRVKQ